MPKALFFNVPAHGHITPSLPLIAELVRRGHHITYYSTPKYRTGIEAAGALFHAYNTIQDDYFDARKLDGGQPQKVAYNLITTAGEILPELLDSARAAQPDYVLFDGMCPWGHLVARIMGLPAVASISLLPIASPPLRTMLNLQLMGTLLPMILRDFDKGIQANRRSRALGKQYNIPPLGPTEILNVPGDIAVCYTSAYFQPYADTVSETVRFVGWTLNERPSNETFSFERVGGRRLIYVSLGTMNSDNPGFFKACIEAFGGDNNYVIISTGNRIAPDSFGALPENIAIYSWVPQIDVLKRAALFVTHAGLNSLHDGLYLGVPLLLVPQQGEQTFNALRVVELGAGLMLKNAQVTPEAIRAVATRLLTESSYKIEAQRIGDTLRDAGGAGRAADEIESLLQKYASTVAK